MINKFKKTLLCSALAVITVACSSNVDNEAPVDVETEVPANDATTNDVSVDQSEKASEVQAEAAAPSMPLEDYVDINRFEDISYLTPLFLAQTTREMSDEDKLGLMSIEYHSEPDQFKKSDLAKTLLPEINKELDQYKGDLGIKIPFGNIDKPYNPYHSTYTKYAASRDGVNGTGIGYQGVGGESISLEFKPFEFEKSAFPISQCLNARHEGFNPRRNSNNRISNEQDISMYFVSVAPEQSTFTNETLVPNQYRYTYDNIYCGLEVKDQEKAREIEGLRTSQKLDTKGFMYYKVTANQNELIAKPVYAKYTLYNIDTGEDLATQEFTWSDKDKI